MMSRSKKLILVHIPVECLPDIDAFKNKIVGEKWDAVKLTSRGKIIRYIIEDWKRLIKEIRIASNYYES